MHLESMRQAIYEPMTNALTALLGQSSYFGKALIRNSIYIDNVIGTRDNLIERVPVDVLSHDTFEAALLRPLYCGSVFLLEAPSYNYVTWNIRERRWNRGEVLLSMYFWKNALGRPMRWIQSKLQGDKFNRTKLRTESKLDFVTSYIAHSALRQMMMKPLLLVYILIHYKTSLLYRWASIIVVMFLVLVFPKFATCNRNNYKYVLLETLASFLQFTPEALVGCVRIIRAVQANLVVNAKWVPQRAVEEQFKQSNPFVSSFKHLWGYSAFALVSGVLVVIFVREAILITVMLGTLLLLPLYTGFTSLSKDFRSSRAIAARREALERGAVSTISKSASAKIGSDDINSALIPVFRNFAFESEGGVSDSSTDSTLRIPRPRLYPLLDLSDLQRTLLASSGNGATAGVPTSSQYLGVQPPPVHIVAMDQAAGQPSSSLQAFHEQVPPVPQVYYNQPSYVHPSAPPATPDLSVQRSPRLPTAYSTRTFQSGTLLDPVGLLAHVTSTATQA